MNHSFLTTIPMFANFIMFAIFSALVWISGTRLTLLADTISDRLRIGKAVMGLVFLAASTELPELVTTIVAAMEGNSSLVLNNMFGGIVMQTAILGVADATVIGATLTYYPRKPTPALEGVFLILMLSLLLAVRSVGDLNVGWNIGLGSLLLSIAYFVILGVLRKYDSTSHWRPVEVSEDLPIFLGARSTVEVLDKFSLRRLYVHAGIAISCILFGGIGMIFLAETLAVQTGLGSSFIGVTLLAGATSLPELSTTLSAVRIGAFTMAISNIFGSNLIMVALLLPADLFYREGPLLSEPNHSADFALIAGIVVTSIYVVGLLMRHKRRLFGLGVDSLIVLFLYAISLIVFYGLRE